jgi:hypothetical protein
LRIVSKSAFGRLHDVTHQTVDYWAAHGHLELTAGGRVKVEPSDVKLEGARLGKFAIEDEPPGGPQEIGEFLAGLIEGKSGTKSASGQVKDSALAGLRALEFQRKAGALIELDAVQTLFFELSRGFRDALLSWPSQVGPLIAADLDLPAGRVTELLEQHVRALIAGMGEPDFGDLLKN